MREGAVASFRSGIAFIELMRDPPHDFRVLVVRNLGLLRRESAIEDKRSGLQALNFNII
jgi:hypothetical protein